MLNWLKRRGNDVGIPEYSAVRKTPNRGLPPELAEKEASLAYRVPPLRVSSLAARESHNGLVTAIRHPL
jgi:hypothetical protein